MYKQINIVIQVWFMNFWFLSLAVCVLQKKKKKGFDAQITLGNHELNPFKEIDTEFLHVYHIIISFMTFW